MNPKAKKTKPLVHLFRALRGSRLLFSGAVLAILLQAAVSLVDPLVLRFVLDSVIGGRESDAPAWVLGLVDRLGGMSALARSIWICALVFVGAGLVSAVLMFARGALAGVAAERATKRLRDALHARILDLPYRYFGEASSGDLVQRCTSDVDTVKRFLATQFVDVARAVALLVLTLVAMLGVDRRMTLAALPIVPGIFAFSYLFFRKIQKAFQTSDEAEAALSQLVQENLHGVRVVRAFAREDFELGRLSDGNRRYTDEVKKLIDLFGWYWSISGWMCMAQTGLVLAVGATLASRGLVSAGTLVAFFAYVGRLLWPVRQLGRTLTDLGKTAVALKRLGEILDELDEYGDDGVLEARGRGRIEFDRVSFAFSEGQPVLDGVSFAVEPGETVAILARTGGGKSTLVHLLGRLMEPDSGAIRLDGVDLREISKRSLRERVGIVLQEPFLFSDTLRGNVTLGLDEGEALDEAVLAELAANAGLSSTVAGFPDGWETKVGEEGVTLSGGQRQRAAIARALARKPDVLVLDDALSALDTETDSAVRAALAASNGGRGVTTIVVSHRMTTLAAADRIVVLDKGRVAAIGTHGELLARPGLYRRVWEIQAGLEQDFAAADASVAGESSSSSVAPAPGGSTDVEPEAVSA